MPFAQPFDDMFRQEAATMSQDPTLSDTALHDAAARHLQVLADPSFANIDQPAWVHRVQQCTQWFMTYTSRSLFDALYQTADELGLVAGKRYVSATVCVCAGRAEARAAAEASNSLQLQEGRRRTAEALSGLASAWTAHLLWPFFLDGTKIASKVIASRISLPRASERTALRSDNDSRLVTKEDLLKRSGYMCFMTEYVYLRAPRELFDESDPEPITIADLQVAHIFRPPGALREHGMREDDVAMVITYDILNHYCEGPVLVDPSRVQVSQGETPSLIDARNALALEPNSCAAFHSFKWCLHPSRDVANEYRVEIYQRNVLGAQYAASPNPVIFEDHSHMYQYSSTASSGSAAPAITPPGPAAPLSDNPQPKPKPPREPGSQRGVDLPDAELLRVHAALAGALQLSGAMMMFEAIESSCKPHIPGASGSAFLRSVVAYEGREVCADVEMRGIHTE